MSERKTKTKSKKPPFVCRRVNERGRARESERKSVRESLESA